MLEKQFSNNRRAVIKFFFLSKNCKDMEDYGKKYQSNNIMNIVGLTRGSNSIEVIPKKQQET
jgi:hypothetical protein